MITRIHIQGYKSIADQEVELRPINVLIGGNGVGKSNFISSFSLLRNIYDKNLQSYVLRKGGADTILYMGSKYTKGIHIDACFQQGHNLNRYIVDLENAQDRLFIYSSKTAYYSKKWHFQQCDANVEEASIRDDRTGQAWYVGPLMSRFMVFHFHDTSDTSPMKSSSVIHDNSYLRKDGSNIAAYLYYLQEKHPKNFQMIEKTISSVSPFFESFALHPSRLNPEQIRLEWKQKGAEDTYFNAYQLSDGTLRFICLATLLMQPEPPATIIIDEPELGLHPAAINKFVALVKSVSRKSQIIISTQSTNLVDGFDVEDIIVVDRENNQSTFRRLSKENLENWLSDYSLSDLWEKNVIGGQL